MLCLDKKKCLREKYLMTLKRATSPALIHSPPLRYNQSRPRLCDQTPVIQKKTDTKDELRTSVTR